MSRKSNREELNRCIVDGVAWKKNLEHTLDRWGILDSQTELRQVHLGRWSPETRVAITAARKALAAASLAVARETARRKLI